MLSLALASIVLIGMEFEDDILEERSLRSSAPLVPETPQLKTQQKDHNVAAMKKTTKMVKKTLVKKTLMKKTTKMVKKTLKKKRSKIWPVPDSTLCDKSITLGTHFSGMEQIKASLLMNRVPVHHSFACDNCESCKKFIANNFEVEHMYGDILEVPMSGFPTCDLYVAGSPCPAFTYNTSQPLGDEDPRGALLFKTCEYVEIAKPKTFIFEQVNSITSPAFQNVFDRWIRRLEMASYKVYWKILNTREHALPQNRARVYLVGFRIDVYKAHRGSRKFHWPKALPLASNLFQFLHRRKKGEREELGGKVFAENLAYAKKFAEEKGWDFDNDCIVIDHQASQSHKHCTKDFAPCLTRSRCMGRGYFITAGRHRCLSDHELGRLQGVDLRYLNLDGISAKHLRSMIGNAMSRNVLDRLVPRVLFAAGLLHRIPPDFWADSVASSSLGAGQ